MFLQASKGLLPRPWLIIAECLNPAAAVGTCLLTWLEHFSVKWIRFAVKK